MPSAYTRFGTDERGSVSADWVVVTASVIVLAMALVLVIEREAIAIADRTGGRIVSGVSGAEP